jgi:tetratricopeptide (TPR) repeat protein
VKTIRGTVVGTAGYMSPEQAMAYPATAASDMFSVGVILQELFTGSPPFERESTAPALIAKTVKGERTPVTGLAPDLTALITRLQSYAPGTRPSAVDALAELDRYIDRPKRRRRRAIVAAVWVSLAALAAGMTVQWVRASREADRANREAIAAREVSDFLVGLFEESNPEQARGASLSAEQILQRGAERVSTDLADQPLTRATLMLAIGRVYQSMGLYTDALPFFEKAFEIRSRQLGEDHADTAAALRSLGSSHRKNGNFGKAETHLVHALELHERIFGPDHLEVAKTLMSLAILDENSGRLGEAEPKHQRALAIYEAELGPDNLEVAKCLGNLAVVIARQGRVAEAEPMLRRALAIRERELGADHPETLAATTNLGIALKQLGRYDEAEPLYRRSLEIEEKVLGKDHPDLAKGLQNLANLYSLTDRFDKAEQLYLRALGILEAEWGREHLLVARCLNNLGHIHMLQGRMQEGEARCLESLAVWERMDPENPEVSSTMFNLAEVSFSLGRFAQAEEYYRRCLSIRTKTYAPGHPRRLSVVKEYAEFLREMDRDDEAVALEAQETAQRPAPS